MRLNDTKMSYEIRQKISTMVNVVEEYDNLMREVKELINTGGLKKSYIALKLFQFQ